MVVPIFCLVVLFFLSWVLLLKTEIAGLKDERRTLIEKLEGQTRWIKGGIEVGKGRRLTSSEVTFAERKPGGGRGA